MAALPVIKHCLQQKPNLAILLTTTTISAFEVIKDRLPDGIVYQFSPLDTPGVVDSFLQYWKPTAVFLMESELWPNLILSASEKGIAVALLNAHISAKSFKLWSGPAALPLISLMLSKFSLIAPLNTQEAIRFQLLQAPPFAISFAGDLKYAVGDVDISETESRIVDDLCLQLVNRPIWMAASVHKGEDEGQIFALLTPLVDIIGYKLPTLPSSGGTTYSELRSLYRLTPIAVIGGSFLPGLAGHNIAEAAAAGCAVLTGPFVGHFSHMVLEMQRSDKMSVIQVSAEELIGALDMLLSNPKALQTHRQAAKQAFLALSSGVVRNVWSLVDAQILKKASLKENEV
ncbi:hypothetical protein ACLOJK_020780 [Asimina triloba]